jgi:NAD(P)-dependent dehydrogenase (short-subunit alcohol dehydrogenase family)
VQTQRVVLITGAAGNLGRAVAKSFAAQGALLALVDLHRDKLVSSFGQQDERRAHFPADLGNASEADAAAKAAIDRFGRIDVLCNLAGAFRCGAPVHETQAQTWDLLFEANVRTVVHMARAVVPFMLAQGGGNVVNVSAFAAQKGLAQMGAYIASKSAVIRLTESMAAELRDKNINVNCVLPATLDTPENRASNPQAAFSQWLDPADLASVIQFLASGAALPVTGLAA